MKENNLTKHKNSWFDCSFFRYLIKIYYKRVKCLLRWLFINCNVCKIAESIKCLTARSELCFSTSICSVYCCNALIGPTSMPITLSLNLPSSLWCQTASLESFIQIIAVFYHHKSVLIGWDHFHKLLIYHMIRVLHEKRSKKNLKKVYLYSSYWVICFQFHAFVKQQYLFFFVYIASNFNNLNNNH